MIDYAAENLITHLENLIYDVLLPPRATCTLSPTIARRLAISRQRLAGIRPPANSVGIMEVMHDLRYLQIDPMKVVAPSHLLVLWSRLGSYEPSLVDELLWKDRQLFEDWAQATSIVLAEDYPIFETLKYGFAEGDSPWARKIRDWMHTNRQFRSYILKELKSKGPILSGQFEDKAVKDWTSTGWTHKRNIDMMLTFLKAQGKVVTAGRIGNQRLWDLTEHFLPKKIIKEKLSDNEVARRASQLSLRALGVGTRQHIEQHYIRCCYHNLAEILAELEAEEQILRVEIREDEESWPGTWYIHAEDMPLLDSLEAGEWKPQTTLLSPFDNLISDRKRTEQLFNFQFRFEVYVPKPQRMYVCYVMPILMGDRFIGRIDPVMDRKTKRLMIRAVHSEQNAPKSNETAQAIAYKIEELGTFLGAETICYSTQVPLFWKEALS